MACAWADIHKWIVRYSDTENPDFSVLQRLISEDSFCVVTTTDRNSVLHLAAIGKHPTVLRYLLNLSPTNFVNSRNRRGETPLHWAIYNGRIENIKLLLHYKANTRIFDAYGNSILHYSVESGNRLITKMILKHNICAVNSRNKYGQSALDVALEMKYTKMANLIQEHSFCGLK